MTTKKAATDDFVPRRAKDVLARKNHDGTVAIMRLDNDQYFFTLDGIAAELWTLIDGKASLAQIKEKIIAKHEPPEGRFARDVKKLLSDLKKEKLILS